jgi:hypothetical protein
MAKRPREVRNLVVVSDLHCGCRLGLCPPKPFRLDDGGTYTASEFQTKVWALWREFWSTWVQLVTNGEPFDVLVNGDALDGVPHRAKTPISTNLDDQQRIAEAVLGPVVKQCHASGGQYYHVRGTEAHVGKSAEEEERLARVLGAKPNRDGQHARWDLWKRVGGASDGALVHCLHHIGTTGSAAHEASAVNAELTAHYEEAARWRKEPPDFIVRSHRHRSIAVDVNSARGNAAAIVTPAWQGRTPFAFKVPGARLREPQFGGILIRSGGRERYYLRWIRTLERSAEE